MNNHTGRYFQCIGLEEKIKDVTKWGKWFKIGQRYREVKKDNYGHNFCNKADVLLLCCKDNLPWYVDKDQFEEVPEGKRLKGNITEINCTHPILGDINLEAKNVELNFGTENLINREIHNVELNTILFDLNIKTI